MYHEVGEHSDDDEEHTHSVVSHHITGGPDLHDHLEPYHIEHDYDLHFDQPTHHILYKMGYTHSGYGGLHHHFLN